LSDEERYPIIAPLPPDEIERLEALHRYDILDTDPEQSFDDITLLASHICDTPVALITLLDEKRQWFKSKVGLTGTETSRDIAFCAHGILQPDVFVVEDARIDDRFCSNPMVTGGPQIRFYAGAPLTTADGHALGMLCVTDQVPRELSGGQKDALQALSRQVVSQLELRHSLKAKTQGEDKLRASELSYRRLFEAARDGVLILDVETGRIVDVNPYFSQLLGFSFNEIIGKTVGEMSPFKDIESNQIMLERLKNEGFIRYDDLPLETKDGRKIAVEFVCNIYLAGDKNVIQCNIRDITQHKRIQESLNLFRTLIDRSPDAIEIVDPETSRILDVNQTACERLGYSREELLSMSIPEIIVPEASKFSVQANLEEIRRTGMKIIVGRHRRKDGSTFPSEVNIQYVHLNRDYLVAVVRDITERLQTEESQRKESAFISAVVDTVSSLVIVLDRAGNVVQFNRACEQLSGYLFDEIKGKNIVETFLLQEEKEAVKLVFDEVCTGKFPNIHDNFWITKSGDLRLIAWSNTAMLDAQGQVEYIIGTGIDITERKLHEAQISQQAELLDKARDAILVRDLEGGLLFWNKGAERMYGWTREEALGRHAGDFLFVDPLRFPEINGLTLSQGEWHGEIQHRTKLGTEVMTEARWTLIRDQEGAPKSVLSIDTDITERKKIEAQFLRAQRMESIGTLAGGIAHDLNNILAPIMMSIDLLQQTAKDPQAKKFLETIQVSAKRGSDIVRQVLSFARGIEGQRIEVQTKHLLNELESIIQNTFPKDIQLNFSVPSDIWTIMGDPTQIHQILLNLCVNARDAMSHGGTLTIEVENSVLDDHYVIMNPEATAGRYVNINVRDTGTGIPQAILDKIFEPFFTTKELNKGTGLGLSTVMAIVKSHHGIIDVSSELGTGTTFKIFLPAMEMPVEAQGQAAPPINLPRGNDELVLIVDDEASILIITGQTLQAFGYRVLTATDGAEAVAVYAQNRKEIAVVVTDMMMPIMNGEALIRALTKINPAVKIVAVSGLSANGDIAQAASVKHTLTKPYTSGTLLKVMRTILDEA